jgi:putative endonuclease
MYTVYVLYSEDHGKIYIGFTGNLDARILSHNELGSKGWTIKFRPWKLMHTEEYQTKTEALKREKELKTAGGREWIWDQLIRKR